MERIRLRNSDEAAQVKLLHPLRSEFQLLFWNIQGLLEDFLDERIHAVVDVIAKKRPTVVILQELVESTYSVLKRTLGCTHSYYSPFDIQEMKPNYFTAIFIDKSRFSSAEVDYFRFPRSIQGRDVLIVSCPKSGVVFITSHLESHFRGVEQRKTQLVDIYHGMLEQPDNSTIIFAGDTNLLDNEFESVVEDGKFDQSKVADVWDFLGSQESVRYTWDPDVNDNDNDGVFPKSRLDRVYFRPPRNCAVNSFKPYAMELVGKEKLPCGLHPSDHWGMLINFVEYVQE